jgi:dienelactone hydrolase
MVSVTSLSTPAMVFIPRRAIGKSNHRFGPGRPLVILNHAAGQTERQFYDLPPFRALLDALLEQGYIVAMSRLTDNPDGGYYNWGNRKALDANFELYSYIVSRYGVDTTRVAMLGNSMGGLVTLTSIPDGRIPVRCAALYYPVTHLRGQYNYNAQMATGINFAYGINPDGSNFEAQTIGHDPQTRDARDWAGVRLRFYGGDGDRIVPWYMHGGAFARLVAGAALESEVVTLEGDHNVGVEKTTDDLTAFIARCFE